MNIRVGDEVHHHYGAENQSPTSNIAKRSLLAKAAPLLLAGALGAFGVGIPWLLASLGGATAEAVAPPATVDTDTKYLLELVPSDE